jgi:uncharacterized protein
MQDILSVLAGSLVGFVLGLVGGGGSIIAVPLLLYLVGVPSVHMAIGTSAVAVALSALGNVIGQLKQGLIKWPCALVFSASGILGNVGGAALALQIPGQQLIILFGALMLIVGLLMLLKKNAEGEPDVRLSFKTAKRMAPWLIGSGLVVGALSGFFGIGGGFLIVPAMMLATGMPISHGIATSLVPITVFGATTATNYGLAGEVNWTLAGLFVGGGILGGSLGTFLRAALAQHKSILNTIFAVFVIATGLYVIAKSIAAV